MPEGGRETRHFTGPDPGRAGDDYGVLKLSTLAIRDLGTPLKMETAMTAIH